MKRIYKNWTFHNLIGHPVMGILNLIGANKIGRVVHDSTLPPLADSAQKEREK